jgi:tol-pal system protein YbgF
MIRRLGAIVALALLAAGCASGGALQKTQSDVTALRAEVAELRRSLDLTVRELARTVGETRASDARGAELQATVRDQSAEVARLRARLDAAEQELRELKAQAAAQPTAPGPTTPAPSAPSSDAPATPAPGAPEPATPSRPGARENDDAGRAFDVAMASFRAREHGQAVLELHDFLARYPAHALAPRAQYWIGEAYYVQRDYRQAVIEFARVVDMAPASPAAADALLKIGLAHTNLRENSYAQRAWQRIVQDYPASEAADKARTLLRAQSVRRP